MKRRHTFGFLGILAAGNIWPLSVKAEEEKPELKRRTDTPEETEIPEDADAPEKKESPKKIVEVDFTGHWILKLENGAEFKMFLYQRGTSVSGLYENPKFGRARVEGEAAGKTFRFKWHQELDGEATFGKGRFVMADDGQTLAGVYETDDPNFKGADEFRQGSWKGVRLPNL